MLRDVSCSTCACQGCTDAALPITFLTGHGDNPKSVRAIEAVLPS
jgi:hypothetical protein